MGEAERDRVAEEKAELDARIARLEARLDDPEQRRAVSLIQYDLMRRQQACMLAYSSVLKQRLAEGF